MTIYLEILEKLGLFLLLTRILIMHFADLNEWSLYATLLCSELNR